MNKYSKQIFSNGKSTIKINTEMIINNTNITTRLTILSERFDLGDFGLRMSRIKRTTPGNNKYAKR